MRVPCYQAPDGSNFYAKPIEGLFAVYDLGTKRGGPRRRRRCDPAAGRSLGLHRGGGRRARAPAPGEQSRDPVAAGRPELQARRQPPRVGHLAAQLPRRQAPGPRRLQHRREGRRRLALGDLPGAALRGLRALHGPGRGLVLAHLHGLRRIRLRAVPDAADRRASTARPTPPSCRR